MRGAWADGHLAEVAGELNKMEKQTNQIQPILGLRPDDGKPTLYSATFLYVAQEMKGT